MGADQLAGVMEIVKENLESLNKDIDEKLLLEEKRNLAEQAEKKASVWHTTSEVWDDGVIDQEIPENIYQWLFQLYITTQLKVRTHLGSLECKFYSIIILVTVNYQIFGK